MTRLLLAAKSPWVPSIRREHAVCSNASRHGIDVEFYESPADVRTAAAGGVLHWLRGLRCPTADRGAAGVRTFRRSVPVPGHRHQLAAAVDNALLHRTLKRRVDSADTPVVVVNLPWQWPATQGLRVRRVFDAADDWTALLGGTRPHVAAAYARISREADCVIVANPSLSVLFPGRGLHVVENGMPSDLVATGELVRPHRQRMVYVGTLSPRFDAELVSGALDRLSGWTLDLYGECRYPGRGDRPSAELTRLLDRPDGRVRWHGVVERGSLAGVLDAADVALVPNVAAHSRGQSSMKFGDYAARGRPIVSTRWQPDLAACAPPGTWFASTVDEFAAAVTTAGLADTATLAANVAWARLRTWDHQWPKWASAAFGSPTP